ncbi:PREDICTED: uncharacterized protein LOC109173662 isoform X4 [Ipomoea nil]|uniref:uncharacterized protein LOC109173662 isoform X4 n=1 Tax=Ipomoea nil TaxID=35883 RepID=UPI000900B0A5|nr:PREDICTED: uncharacterized protein LOC109173662 isoform X4 [Ipomoea nil]
MGGDSQFFSYGDDSEESSLLGQDFSVRSPASPIFSGDVLGGGVANSESGVGFEGSEANRKRERNSIYMKVWRSYGELQDRSRKYAKGKILGYTPGSWTEGVGGTKLRDYKVPKTTTILLVGPKGSGKSSLVNKISDVFVSKKFASQRAQVSFNPSIGGGTCFAQEYMIPKCEKDFCLYDTPSLSDDQSKNEDMLKHWMTKGVRHGEPIIRASDDVGFETRMECNAHDGYSPLEARPINFAVFVVNALSVLEAMEGAMEGEDEKMKRYTEVVSKAFNSPFLSFKEDKPVVVVTHGDLLSLSERVRVRIHLGELLGIHPKTQIFDIPESDDSGTKVAILDMLHYCLYHADKNLPLKDGFSSRFLQAKVSHPQLSIDLLVTAMLLSFVFGVYYRSHIHHAARTSSAPGSDCTHTFSRPEARNFQHAAKDSSSAPEAPKFQHIAKDSSSAPEAHNFQHAAKDSSSAPEAPMFQHTAKDSSSAPEAHKFQHAAKDSSSAPEAHNFQHAAKDSSPSLMPDAQHRYDADGDSSTKFNPQIDWSKIRHLCGTMIDQFRSADE